MKPIQGCSHVIVTQQLQKCSTGLILYIFQTANMQDCMYYRLTAPANTCTTVRHVTVIILHTLPNTVSW